MARIRTIKPEFWLDEDLSELPPETHMLAAALLNQADDEGYFNAHPSLVKATCSPLRDDSVSVHESLTQLSNVGYIEVGKGEDGKRYGRIVNFKHHQRINRPSPSKIAYKTIAWSSSENAHATLTEHSMSAHTRKGTGNREQGTGKGSSCADAQSSPAGERKQSSADRFDDFWNAYPQKKGKQKALQIWKSKKLDRIADDIIADVQKRQQMDVQWQDKQFIPHGSTYLSKEVWQDEITTTSQVGNRSPSAGGQRDGFAEWFERNGMDANGADAGTVIEPDDQNPALTLLHGGAR